MHRAVPRVLVPGLTLLAACGGASIEAPTSTAPADPKRDGTSIEVAELDIHADGVDRFVNCPPPGELGQDWIPPIPAWTPSAPSPPSSSAEAPAAADPALAQDVPAPGGTPTERAIAYTRDRFRACYNHGLVYDPTQDGHVAIVARVGADGRVADVESWGACELASPSIECMRDVAKKLRFPRPAEGSATVTIPAVFTSSRALRERTPRPSDVYAAAAYVAVEALRPALHSCERAARSEGRAVIAAATFNLSVDARGHVVHSTVEPWAGDKELLGCAASALLAGLHLAPPAGGEASVIVRLAFNPRSGSK